MLPPIKASWYACIILSFLAIPAALYLYKFRDATTTLDELKAALENLRSSSPKDARFGIRSFTQVPEVDFIIANAMVPVIIVPNSTILDTTMYVFDRNDPDSLLHAVLADKHKFWMTKSEHFQFILTTQGPQ